MSEFCCVSVSLRQLSVIDEPFIQWLSDNDHVGLYHLPLLGKVG